MKAPPLSHSAVSGKDSIPLLSTAYSSQVLGLSTHYTPLTSESMETLGIQVNPRAVDRTEALLFPFSFPVRGMAFENGDEEPVAKIL